MSKRVVFMGKGALAVKCAQWFLDSPDYEIAYVVPVIPEPAWTESLSAWAAKNGVPVNRESSGSLEGRNLLTTKTKQRQKQRTRFLSGTMLYDVLLLLTSSRAIYALADSPEPQTAT